MGEYSWIIAGFIVMIVGAVLISRAKRRANRCSASAVATITSIDKSQRTNDEGHNLKGYDYTPHFSYVVAGQTYNKRADYSTTDKNEFVVGGTINIQYNPLNPDEVMITGKSAKAAKTFGTLVLLLGVIVLIVGALAQK